MNAGKIILVVFHTCAAKKFLGEPDKSSLLIQAIYQIGKRYECRIICSQRHTPYYEITIGFMPYKYFITVPL